MALHKFTPGGCRSNCDSVDECCHPTVCQAGSPATEYTVAIYKSGVLQCSWTLDQHVVATHPTAGYVCYWYASAGQAATICGTAATYYAVLNFYTGGGLTGCGIAIRTTNYPSTTGTALSGQSGSLGASPADCGVSFSGSLTNFDPSCTETWTYQVTAGATPCSTTGTQAGSGGTCCPCEDCRVFRDPFNRAPGTDMGSNWSEVAGDWTLTAYGTARIESANAQLISTSAASQVGVKLMSMVRADASGDIVRLILSYVDADNYLFAEWKCGSNGYLRIYERDTGTDTLLDEVDAATSANYFTLLTVCVNDSGTSLTAVVSQGGSAPAFVSGELASTAVAGKYGLATGATCSGASFGRVELVKTSPGCEACASDCDLCTESAPEFVVDLGATPWVTDPDACCQAIHGEFTVAAIPKSAIPSWVYSVTGTSCDLWPVYDTCYWAYNDSSCNLWVIVRVGTATTGLHWAVDVHVLIGTQTTHRKWVYSKRLGLTSSPLDCAAGWTVDNFCGGGITGVGECVGGTASPPSSVTVAPP